MSSMSPEERKIKLEKNFQQLYAMGLDKNIDAKKGKENSNFFLGAKPPLRRFYLRKNSFGSLEDGYFSIDFLDTAGKIQSNVCRQTEVGFQLIRFDSNKLPPTSETFKNLDELSRMLIYHNLHNTLQNDWWLSIENEWWLNKYLRKSDNPKITRTDLVEQQKQSLKPGNFFISLDERNPQYFYVIGNSQNNIVEYRGSVSSEGLYLYPKELEVERKEELEGSMVQPILVNDYKVFSEIMTNHLAPKAKPTPQDTLGLLLIEDFDIKERFGVQKMNELTLLDLSAEKKRTVATWAAILKAGGSIYINTPFEVNSPFESYESTRNVIEQLKSLLKTSENVPENLLNNIYFKEPDPFLSLTYDNIIQNAMEHFKIEDTNRVILKSSSKQKEKIEEDNQFPTFIKYIYEERIPIKVPAVNMVPAINNEIAELIEQDKKRQEEVKIRQEQEKKKTEQLFSNINQLAEAGFEEQLTVDQGKQRSQTITGPGAKWLNMYARKTSKGDFSKGYFCIEINTINPKFRDRDVPFVSIYVCKVDDKGFELVNYDTLEKTNEFTNFKDLQCYIVQVELKKMAPNASKHIKDKLKEVGFDPEKAIDVEMAKKTLLERKERKDDSNFILARGKHEGVFVLIGKDIYNNIVEYECSASYQGIHVFTNPPNSLTFPNYHLLKKYFADHLSPKPDIPQYTEGLLLIADIKEDAKFTEEAIKLFARNWKLVLENGGNIYVDSESREPWNINSVIEKIKAKLLELGIPNEQMNKIYYKEPYLFEPHMMQGNKNQKINDAMAHFKINDQNRVVVMASSKEALIYATEVRRDFSGINILEHVNNSELQKLVVEDTNRQNRLNRSRQSLYNLGFNPTLSVNESKSRSPFVSDSKQFLKSLGQVYLRTTSMGTAKVKDFFTEGLFVFDMKNADGKVKSYICQLDSNGDFHIPPNPKVYTDFFSLYNDVVQQERLNTTPPYLKKLLGNFYDADLTRDEAINEVRDYSPGRFVLAKGDNAGEFTIIGKAANGAIFECKGSAAYDGIHVFTNYPSSYFSVPDYKTFAEQIKNHLVPEPEIKRDVETSHNLLLIEDFDDTLVNTHWHHYCMTRGVSPGYPDKGIAEFLLHYKGTKHFDKTLDLWRKILNTGGNICVASHSRYPGLVRAVIEIIKNELKKDVFDNNGRKIIAGISEKRLNEIYYKDPNLFTDAGLDAIKGKDNAIRDAKSHFGVMDNRLVILVDDDKNNITKAKTAFPGIKTVQVPLATEVPDVQSPDTVKILAPDPAYFNEIDDCIEIALKETRHYAARDDVEFYAGPEDIEDKIDSIMTEDFDVISEPDTPKPKESVSVPTASGEKLQTVINNLAEIKAASESRPTEISENVDVKANKDKTQPQGMFTDFSSNTYVRGGHGNKKDLKHGAEMDTKHGEKDKPKPKG